MRRKPVLVAGAVVGAVFILFLVLILAAGRISGPQTCLLSAHAVGVVEVIGPITQSRQIVDQIRDFREDASVRAIVLRIDSPGGGVGPSQEIYDELVRTTAVKPVVASMGSIAASGGYYIAAPCSRIYANPGTLTGSIGAIMEFADLRRLFDKVGFGLRVVKSGAHKDIGSPAREMTAEEKKLLQGVIDDACDQFVQAVAHSRKLEPAYVRSLADGRIFTGRQAKQVKLVDKLGGLQAALREAAVLGGIKGEPKAVYPRDDKPGLIDLLLENAVSSVRRIVAKNAYDGLQFMWSRED